MNDCLYDFEEEFIWTLYIHKYLKTTEFILEI